MVILGLCSFGRAQETSQLPPRTFADLAEKAGRSVVSIQVWSHYPLPFDREVLGEELFLRRLDTWASMNPEFEVTEDSFFTPRSGSGVVIRSDGYLITSWHLLEGLAPRDRVRVKFLNGETYEGDEVKLVGHDPLTDIAVLRVEGRDLPSLEWGSSEEAKPGDWVLVIGNPLDFAFSVSQGIVSGKHRQVGSKVQIEDLIQTTAMINPGSSGGAMIDLNGRLIGMVMAMASSDRTWQGLGFAIPERIARAVAESIIDHGRPRRAFLGILMEQVTRFRAEMLGLPAADGVRITRILPGYPAGPAGLREDDIIVAIEGRPVRSLADVIREIGTRDPGESVRLGIVREAEGRRTLQVALGENPDQGELADILAKIGGEDLRSRAPIFGDDVSPPESGPDILKLLGLRVIPRPGDRGGVIVLKVVPGSPAERAELQSGDIVLALGGADLSGITDFRRLLLAAGPDAELDILRKGEVLKLHLRLPAPLE